MLADDFIDFFFRVHDVIGDVLFSTKASSPYDLALVQMRDPATGAVVPTMAQSYNPGKICDLFRGNELHLASRGDLCSL